MSRGASPLVDAEERTGVTAERTRRMYPSDLSDAQWRGARMLLSERELAGRRPLADLRRIVDAINYRWRTGCAWRMLPHDFPPWQTVYGFFRRCQQAGRLTDLRDVVLRPRVRNAGRDVTHRTDPESADVRASDPRRDAAGDLSRGPAPR